MVTTKLGNEAAAASVPNVLTKVSTWKTLRAAAPDSRAAFAFSPGDNRMPGGMYRNQFWFPYPGSNVMLCLGIHGKMVYINRAAQMVAVKFSSRPYPQDASKLFPTIGAFDAISAALSPAA